MKPILDFQPDAVILANGTFPTHAIPLAVLHQTPCVVCCDGAVAHWPGADAVVGDGDSIPPSFHGRLVQVSEQEDNDLTKATRYCLEHCTPVREGRLRLAYLGATGLREDHTIANISLMVRYRQDMGIEPIMLTDYGWFVVGQGRQTFDSFEGQQVSIFNFGSIRLTSEGLRWNSYPYKAWWQGTLNEAIGNCFSLDADGYYLVYRTYETRTPRA